jgi:hypothetical protein
MNLECLNVLHEITVESHPVPIITAYTGAYVNTLTRRQIVKTSGTISLQVKISISLYQFIFETIPLNQSQYSFLLDNIHVPLLWTSPCRNFMFVLIIFTDLLIACAWGLISLACFHMYMWIIPS